MWFGVADNGANTSLASSPLLFLEFLDFLSASSSICNRYQPTVAHLIEKHRIPLRYSVQCLADELPRLLGIVFFCF